GAGLILGEVRRYGKCRKERAQVPKNGSNSGEKFPYPVRNSYEVVHYNFCSYLCFRYGFEINP
ncbi:MAG: hypothetical protein ACQEQO_06880, partial [Thermodesulfobacteriota bacterium]